MTTTAVGVERVTNGYIIRSSQGLMPRIYVANDFEAMVEVLRKELVNDEEAVGLVRQPGVGATF